MTHRFSSLYRPLALIASALVIGLPLGATSFAEETAPAQQERVVLGQRKPPKELSEKEVSKGIRKEAKKTQRNKNKTEKRAKKAEKQQWKAKDFGAQRKGNFYTPTYLLKSVGASGKTLVTNDETVWSIDPYYAPCVSRWPAQSRIVIKPNRFHVFDYRTWFTSHDYWLYNQTTGERALADLENGPLLKYAILINTIRDNYIQLSDGSIWIIEPSFDNLDKLRDWKVQQAVLIGENDNVFGYNDYILINLNENNYVSVQCRQLPFGYSPF